jgi:hypothetical protein
MKRAALVASFFLSACSHRSPAPEPQKPVTQAKPVDAAPAATPPVADAAPVAVVEKPKLKECPALTIDVPPIELVTKHDAEIPDLVDFGDTMDPFFEKLARLARGTPGTMVRIGIYGDSNLANDRTSGWMRRRVQKLWGDGGHGWVAFGKPWGWYQHMDLQHGTTGKWDSWNLSNHRAYDDYYGHAGTAAESSEPGATAWVATAKKGSPVGTTVDSFDLCYLARPKGGKFEVILDGNSKETIDTLADAVEVRCAHYDVDEGPHQLTAKVVRGRVRLFGVASERKAPGIVIDSLGVGSLNVALLDTMDHTTAAAGLKQRDYDLVIQTSGSNMWSTMTKHAAWTKSLVELWRATLPHAGIMFWSPPDMLHKGTVKSEPHMQEVTQWMHASAEDNKVAFWDNYAMLGGATMPRWVREGWAEPDGLHLGPAMNQYVAERFVHVLLVELKRRVEKNPRLGCDE